MTSDEQEIVKVKNPKRVAAGKRGVEARRLKREEGLKIIKGPQDEIKGPQDEIEVVTPTDKPNYIKYGSIIGIIGLLLLACTSYVSRRDGVQARAQARGQVYVEPAQVGVPTQKGKIDPFDF